MIPERLQQIIELERASRPWPADATTWMIAARQAMQELIAEVQRLRWESCGKQVIEIDAPRENVFTD